MVILVTQDFFCVGCPCEFCRQPGVYVLKEVGGRRRPRHGLDSQYSG